MTGSSLISAVRERLTVHSDQGYKADQAPWKDALDALDQIEKALQAAYELTDGFVMGRVGPRNYEPFYEVRTKVAEALGHE